MSASQLPDVSSLLPKSETLEMFVVYEKPLDFPSSVVVRRWQADADGAFHPDAGLPSIIAPSVERAREGLAMLRSGLSLVARHPDDEPQIVEMWV